MRLIPRGDRLIVEEIGGKSETESGIIIPDSFKDNTDIQQCKILQKGAKVGEDLKEGMIVCYMKGAGTPFNLEKDSKQKLRVIRDPDLIAIIEKDEQ